MGKKKKSKYYDKYDYNRKKKGNKKPGGKKGRGFGSAYEPPKLKSVKPSLEKKEAKENKRIVLAPVDIPAKFIKNRRKCNHAGDLLTPTQFKALTPNYAAYTPMLEKAIAEFGEENVMVCKSCYDVLVNTTKFDSGDIATAITTLYAAANAVVSHQRMKTDEIKAVAKLRDALADWHTVLSTYTELEEKGAFVDEIVIADGGDLSSLNSQDGGAQFIG